MLEFGGLDTNVSEIKVYNFYYENKNGLLLNDNFLEK